MAGDGTRQVSTNGRWLPVPRGKLLGGSSSLLPRSVRNRGNLHIETEALTERLLLDGKRRTGVRYSVAGEVREARARHTVVISAWRIQLAAIRLNRRISSTCCCQRKVAASVRRC
jgi:hypothetical protein